MDLKLRFRVDLRIVRKQKVAVGLLGVGFSARSYGRRFALKHPVCMAIKDSIIELTAPGMQADVLDVHVILECC